LISDKITALDRADILFIREKVDGKIITDARAIGFYRTGDMAIVQRITLNKELSSTYT